jgi:hypothetical protein
MFLSIQRCASLARIGLLPRQKKAAMDMNMALARGEAGCDILKTLIRFGIDRPT